MGPHPLEVLDEDLFLDRRRCLFALQGGFAGRTREMLRGRTQSSLRTSLRTRVTLADSRISSSLWEGPMPASDSSVAKEYRFSVVMYGGVSLAIYMNGVAQELLHMVRSTARTQGDNQFRFAETKGTGPATGTLRSTEAIYRDLARELNDVGVDDVRFIVDVISGTSAGGINGIFLAKALTDDSLSFDVLQQLWIDEGALEKLLNDKQTRKATGLPIEPPKSLLCSDRMYIKLLDALKSMKTPQDGGKPLSAEVDLFVTTTDITGRVIPLRLADMLVWERQYKADFHFRYDHERERNDLKEDNNPFIAFVARCTSSFPFAFEPMRLAKVQELQDTAAWPGVPKVDPQVFDIWEKKFFDNTEQVSTGGNRNRVFGDGGYLNNKPFSFVVEMLGRHSSSFPTERKLIYVEPTPEHPEQEAGGDVAAAASGQNAPNALVNSYDALVKLPGYQPIHDDLQRVIERNRLVRKVMELSAIITATIRRAPAGQEQTAPADAAAASIGDFSYLAMRVYATTDELARVLSEWFQFPKASSFYYAIRCLVRAWREQEYMANSDPGQERAALASRFREFLGKFDIDFEKRRYRFIRQQVNLFYCFDESARERLAKGFDVDAEDLANLEFRKGFQHALIHLKKPFDAAARVIGDAQRQIRPFDKPTPDGAGAKRFLDSPEKYAEAAGLWDRVTRLKACVNKFQSEGRARWLEEKLGTRTRPGTQADADTRSIVEYVLGIKGQETTATGASLEADQDESYIPRARLVMEEDDDLRVAVRETADAMAAILRRAAEHAGEVAAKGIAIVRATLPDPVADVSPRAQGARLAVEMVEFFAANFETFDTALFPLMYDSDVGTPEPISIVRVSPEDATALYDQSVPGRPQKLAGASLAHFGAFLDRSFRTNDILWGRLDGAERIIRSLLPTEAKKEAAKDLIHRAQIIIIQDFLRERQKDLAGLIYEVAKTVDPQPNPPDGWWARRLYYFRAWRARRALSRDGLGIFQEMNDARIRAIRESVRETIVALGNQNFAEAVDGFLTRERIEAYLRQEPPQREPDRRTTLESMTRSVRIVGGILQGMGKETQAAGGILIRAGAALWWLVQAAVPRGLTGHFTGKIFAALFWFEILMIVGGTLFDQAVQSVGLKLLFFTFVLWLFKDAFQRYIRTGTRGLRVTVLWVILGVVAGVGIWAGISAYQGPKAHEKPYTYLHDRLCGCTTPPAK